MTIPPEKEWITYREASEMAGLSRTTLWKLLSTGEIRAAKVGRAVRISRHSLDEYLNQQEYVEFVRS